MNNTNVPNKPIHTFWYNPNNGNELNAQDEACILSWLHQDKHIFFWTYGKIKSDVLQELNDSQSNFFLMDAEDVIPKSDYFIADYSHLGAHGYAMFSDIFRYKLLDMFGGWWLDTDIFLINDTFKLADVEIFGLGKPQCWNERYSTSAGRLMQNNAAIFAPSPRMMDETYERAMQAVKESNELCEQGRGNEVKWGNTGPILLTDMVLEKKYKNCQIEDFYLVDFYAYTGSLAKYAHNELQPEDLVRFFANQPVGVHMWNSYLHKSGKIHPKSLFGIALQLAKCRQPINATNVIQELDKNKLEFPNVCNPNHQK